MNELIKIEQKEINKEVVNTVSARELHKFLGVGKVFAAWIRSRLDTLGSIEDQDYIVLTGESLLSNLGKQTNNDSKSRGGHNRLEYFITLDTAKHIAMMEKNQKGFQIRQYFIEVEKKAQLEFNSKYKYQLAILNSVSDKERMIAMNEYEIHYIKPLEEYKEESKPKVTYYDLVLQCPDLLTITQISQDYPISNQKINKILEQEKIQFKDKSGVWCVYANHSSKGICQTSTHVYKDKHGVDHAKLHLKWTQKGRLFIYDLLKTKGILPNIEMDDYVAPPQGSGMIEK